jgi:hypothetical protein
MKSSALIATIGYLAWSAGLLYGYIICGAWIIQTGSVPAMVLYGLFGTFVFLFMALLPFIIYRGLTQPSTPKKPGGFRQ